MLISPFNTFQSCGISSREVCRNQFPVFVILCSSGSRFPFKSLRFFMVLNLITVKMTSLSPGRRCRKNGFLLFKNHNMIVRKRKSGERIINPVPAIIISRILFPERLYICCHKTKIAQDIKKDSIHVSFCRQFQVHHPN